MTRRNLRRAALAAILLVLTQMGWAQEKTVSVSPRPDKLDGVQRVDQEHSGPQETMGIHGHWAVTIRNSDGTLVSRHEFENSLTDIGKGIVLGFLAGSAYPMQGPVPVWELKVGENLCVVREVQPARKSPGDCLIPVKAQLVVGGKVEMTGTVQIEIAGQIKSVATQITNTASPNKAPIVFSSRDLTQPDSTTNQIPTPINVQPGQNVDFTVDISIS